jgi:hypothetical protein
MRLPRLRAAASSVRADRVVERAHLPGGRRPSHVVGPWALGATDPGNERSSWADPTEPAARPYGGRSPSWRADRPARHRSGRLLLGAVGASVLVLTGVAGAAGWQVWSDQHPGAEQSGSAPTGASSTGADTATGAGPPAGRPEAPGPLATAHPDPGREGCAVPPVDTCVSSPGAAPPDGRRQSAGSEVRDLVLTTMPYGDTPLDTGPGHPGQQAAADGG